MVKSINEDAYNVYRTHIEHKLLWHSNWNGYTKRDL